MFLDMSLIQLFSFSIFQPIFFQFALSLLFSVNHTFSESPRAITFLLSHFVILILVILHTPVSGRQIYTTACVFDKRKCRVNKNLSSNSIAWVVSAYCSVLHEEIFNDSSSSFSSFILHHFTSQKKNKNRIEPC